MDGQSKDSLYLGPADCDTGRGVHNPGDVAFAFQPLRNRELLSHAADDRNRNRMALGAYRTRWQQHCRGLYQTAIAA